MKLYKKIFLISILFFASFFLLNTNITFGQDALLPLPDLTASATSPTSVSVNTSFNFSTLITNQGDASTGNSFMNLFQIADDDQGNNVTDLPAIEITPNLDLNSSQTIQSESYSFDQIGKKFVRACADKSKASDLGTIDEGINEDNNCGPWTVIIINQSNPNPTGTLTATNCMIVLGASSCNTTLVWDTTNPIGTSSVTTPTNITVATANSSTGTPYSVAYGSRDFFLYNNSVLLSQATSTAACVSGTTWDGTMCSAPTGGISATSCTIAVAGNSCTSTVAWSITRPISPNVLQNGISFSTAPSSAGTPRTITYGTTTFTLMDNGKTLSIITATSSCPAGTTWVGGLCALPTGTLTASANSCSILANGTSCTIPFSWTTTNPISTSAITRDGTSGNYQTGNSGTNVSFTIPYSSATFRLYNNAIELANKSVTAACAAGTTWDGGKCGAPITVSVNATTPYTTSPKTNISFSYIPQTNVGSTECLLLDNASSPLTAYQSSSPIVYLSPLTTGSFGYYIKCRNSIYTTVTGTSNLIIVNVISLDVVPTVTTPTVTLINTNKATLGGNVTSLGTPATISDRGTCWGTLPNPTTNCLSEGGTTTGVFTHPRTGLTPNTTYHYRGYATNTTGVGYSDGGTFTTLSIPATGTLTATNCEITTGNSTCDTTLVWNTINPVGTSAVTTPTDITVETANSSSGTTYSISLGSRNFYLYNNGDLLARATATATLEVLSGGICSSPHNNCTIPPGTGINPQYYPATSVYTWECVGQNGIHEICYEETSVDGACGPKHYDCALGTSVNQNGGDPIIWIWDCEGINTGSTAHCTQYKTCSAI